jgi:hypothetical protein
MQQTCLRKEFKRAWLVLDWGEDLRQQPPKK